MKQNDSLDGEVARAITRAALSFSSHVTPTPLGSIRIYTLQFAVLGETKPLPVSAYVTNRLLIASTPLRVVDGPPTWRELVDVLSEVPSARLVSSASTDGEKTEASDVIWLEASSVLPEPGKWNSSTPVSFPIQVVTMAYSLLMERLPNAFARAEDARVPLIELGDSRPAGDDPWDVVDAAAKPGASL